MLIDVHVHTSRTTGIARQTGTRYPLPHELVEMMDANGIDKAVLMNTVSPEFRYALVTPEEVLDICAEYPDRLIPLCGVDPRYLTNSTDADFRPLLRHYKDLGCRGIGEYIPNLAFDHELNLNLFSQVEEIGLPLTFHVATKYGGTYGCYDDLGLPRLERILGEFPKLTYLAHSQAFWSEISADVDESTRSGYPKGRVTPGRVVELMRKYPNLNGDLSAGSGYNAISRDIEFGCSFMEEFQDRLCFGTDIANVPQNMPIVEFFGRLKREQLISAEAYEKIAWKNAARILRIDV